MSTTTTYPGCVCCGVSSCGCTLPTTLHATLAETGSAPLCINGITVTLTYNASGVYGAGWYGTAPISVPGCTGQTFVHVFFSCSASGSPPTWNLCVNCDTSSTDPGCCFGVFTATSACSPLSAAFSGTTATACHANAGCCGVGRPFTCAVTL